MSKYNAAFQDALAEELVQVFKEAGYHTANSFRKKHYPNETYVGAHIEPVMRRSSSVVAELKDDRAPRSGEYSIFLKTSDYDFLSGTKEEKQARWETAMAQKAQELIEVLEKHGFPCRYKISPVQGYTYVYFNVKEFVKNYYNKNK